MTTEQLIGQLRDAIRAEVTADLIDRLQTWRDSLDDESAGYLDGIDDAILTVSQ